ncbi:MAG: long-chain acyl-CoA synthetase [Myxococcales bacterium]|nr:long-chain acyl-CoA synthetase [Myxococcales bacterium]
MNKQLLEAITRESAALVDAVDRDPLVGAVIRGDVSREGYVAFLVATYHYVRWSGPLLAASAAGLRRRGRYPWLAELVAEKALEEAPHDRWALQDLERCGEDLELIAATKAPVAVRAYVDWSLALAETGSPAFLGSAYALELMSMRRARRAAENLSARAAIPNIAGAVSFLLGHGDADVDHVSRLDDVLTRIDDPEDASAIALSAAVLRTLYPCFFRDAEPSATNARRDGRAA